MVSEPTGVVATGPGLPLPLPTVTQSMRTIGCLITGGKSFYRARPTVRPRHFSLFTNGSQLTHLLRQPLFRRPHQSTAGSSLPCRSARSSLGDQLLPAFKIRCLSAGAMSTTTTTGLAPSSIRLALIVFLRALGLSVQFRRRSRRCFGPTLACSQCSISASHLFIPLTKSALAAV